MKRKITAIMAADVAGYTKLVAADEEGTLERLQSSREVFEEFVTRYGGRIFNTAGDAVLAEFASAVEAVRCALEIQESLRTKNLGVPEDKLMQFRLGINIGDVVERDGDLLGDGVNIAARLQTLSKPGGICVSRTVYEQVENKLAVGFADIGPQTVKNLPNPIHAYFVDAQLARTRPRTRPVWPSQLIWGGGAAVLAVVAAASVTLSLQRGPLPRVATAPLQAAVELPRTILTLTPQQTPAPAPSGQAPKIPPIDAATTEPPKQADAVASEFSPPRTQAAAEAMQFAVAFSCEKLAWTGGALYQTDASLSVTRGKVELARPIHWPHITSPVIGIEVGAGTLGSGGWMVVDAGWESARRSYKARYEGTVTARGGTLKGKQDWISDGKPYARKCTLTLDRK